MFDQSLKHGVRLTVQDGCRPDPDPSGPVFLEKVAAMVNCDGKKWSMGTTVICAPDGAQFSPPLLLDFFVRYDASNWDSEEELEKILKDYQVGSLALKRTGLVAALLPSLVHLCLLYLRLVFIPQR